MNFDLSDFALISNKYGFDSAAFRASWRDQRISKRSEHLLIDDAVA